MDFTLTGTILGLFGWNVYLLWKKFHNRKKESKIKSFIEHQANLLISEVAPYKKLKTNNGLEQKQPNEVCFQRQVPFQSTCFDFDDEPTPQKTVLEVVKQEKFLECKYLDGDTTFDFQPLFKKKESKKNKNNKDFSFSSQPQAQKKEVKRCRKLSNINAIEFDEQHETPPREAAEQKSPQKIGFSAIKEFEIVEKQIVNDIQLPPKIKTPPQSPKIENSSLIIQPSEAPVINNNDQDPPKTLTIPQEGNLFASLLSNVQKTEQKTENPASSTPQQTQQSGLFQNLINSTILQKQQEAPQAPQQIAQTQQSVGGLFTNLINKANGESNQIQTSNLFANASSQSNNNFQQQQSQNFSLENKSGGLFGNILNQPIEQVQTSTQQPESIITNNMGGLFGNPQTVVNQQPNQQQPQQSQGLFSNNLSTAQQPQNTSIQPSTGLFGNLMAGNQQSTTTQQTPNTGGLFGNIQSAASLQNQGTSLFSNIIQNNKPQEGGLFSTFQPPQTLQQNNVQQQSSLFNLQQPQAQTQQPQVQPQQQAQQIIQTFGSPQIFGTSFLQNPILKEEPKKGSEVGQLMGGGLFNLTQPVPGGSLFENILKK